MRHAIEFAAICALILSADSAGQAASPYRFDQSPSTVVAASYPPIIRIPPASIVGSTVEDDTAKPPVVGHDEGEVRRAIAYSDERLRDEPVGVPVGFTEFADVDCCAELPACAVCRPSIIGGASYLNWKPALRGLDYALSEDGTSLTVGQGQLHQLVHDSDSGVRAMLGYRTSVGWSLSVRFTAIAFEGRDQIVRPDGIGQLFATRSHPDGNEEADTAAAQGGLDYRVVDLEASKRVIDGPFAKLTVFGGLRWADIQQSNLFSYDGRDFVNGQIREDLQTDGIGLQMGSECTWQLAGGFGLVGRASAGLMRGTFTTHRVETNLNGGVVLVDAADEFDQALPNVELAAGLTWTRGPMTLGAAYEVVNWFNAYDRAMFIDDIHEASFGPFSKDILLDGLTLTLSYSR